MPADSPTPRFIGGPLDGKQIEATARFLIVPGLLKSSAAWYEEDEGVPCVIDPLTGHPRVVPPEFTEHHYERDENGNYRYVGRSQ